MNEVTAIAGRLKALRLIMGLSEEEMARTAGVSPTEYREYEAGKCDFGFTFLFRCARRLGVDITEIVTGEQPTLSFYHVVRGGEGMPIKRREEFDYRHISYLLKERLAEPFVVRAKWSEEASQEPIHLSAHEGQEIDYVLKGTLRVQLEEHIEVLHPGDCVMYDSSHLHGMVASGGEDAEFLAVVIKGSLKEVDSSHSAPPLHLMPSDEPLLYKKFASEVLDSEGHLKDISFTLPDNFNFAYDVVDALARTKPQKLAMLWLSKHKEERRFTFGEMSELSSRAANYLRSLGVKKGDRVMLVLKRHCQFWIAILALHKLGAIAIPASNQLKSHDFSYRFEAAGVSAIIATQDDGICEAVEQAERESHPLPLKCAVNGARSGWQDFDAGVASASPDFPRLYGAEGTSLSDPMLMYFTSGTTGYPKIATHDFSYPAGHIVTARWWQNVDPEGLHFTISDTGWGKAVWGKLYGQWLCEAAVFTFDFDRFDAKEILPLFAQYQITTFCAPPTMYRFFIKEDLHKYDLSSLRYSTIAGEALNPEVFRQWQEATGLKLMEGFGQTETTLTVANLLGTEPKPGAMGKPNPQYDVDLITSEGKSARPGEMGEVVLHTDRERPIGMFIGYYRSAELTEDAWHDGLYHTGDMAWRDEDGYFWYVGRTDDLIKSSGYRIGPFEIESVIMELPYVLECAITGVPDPIRGQVVKATIMLVPGTEGTEELKKEIQVYVKDRTAPYKYPRVVEFVTEFPKTISGKIKRKDIRNQSAKSE